MSAQTHAGDDVNKTQKLVEVICTEFNNLDLQKHENVSNQLQNILSSTLRKEVSVCPKYGKRCFPQLCTEDNCIYIYYFLDSNSGKKRKREDIWMQLSVGAVLVCCTNDFVDDCIGPDETFTSFSKRYPDHYNLATQVYDIISNNFQPQ